MPNDDTQSDTNGPYHCGVMDDGSRCERLVGHPIVTCPDHRHRESPNDPTDNHGPTCGYEDTQSGKPCTRPVADAEYRCVSHQHIDD